MSGIFGVVSNRNCSSDLFYGTDYHTNLGTTFGGMAVYGTKGLERYVESLSNGQFKALFHDKYKKLAGHYGIGAISALDEQPIAQKSKFGSFAVVINGEIQNLEEIARCMMRKGESFSEIRDDTYNAAEVVAKLVKKEQSITQGIEYAFDMIKGSISMLLVCDEGVYAARDNIGVNPLTIGEKEGSLAVTTETIAFQNLHFKYKRDLMAGEIVLLNKDGIHTKVEGKKEGQTCAFLWIYTGYPADTYDGIDVEPARNRCGAMLFRKDQELGYRFDCVTGVPDSGTGHALGYANESKGSVPFERIFIKFTPGYSRSYTPISQEERNLIAEMKLLVVPSLVKGKKVVVLEDSIVRGTQLKNFTVEKLREFGAKEVHVRPACPPLLDVCGYNISTRKKEELIAVRAIRAIEGKEIEDISEYLDPKSKKYKDMVEWIRDYLKIDSLVYPTLDEMAEAIGRPKEKMCTFCWDGKKLIKAH